MIEESSSKLLWYTKSDKEVRYYNPSAHCKDYQVINRRVGHSANNVQFFIFFFFFFNFANFNLLEKLSLR